ncbi:MAG: WD40/YVTN/BNR-like repeat-containing protein [Streptosporangiaceae bacterium]
MVASARVPLLAAAAGLVLGLAGCGSSGASGPGASSGAGAGSPPRSGSSPSVSAQAPGGAVTTAGPVPAGFGATSVTFVSADEAFVLGTAPCAHAPCTSIVRTLDRGASWAGLPAPPVPVGEPGLTSAPIVWGIRFATPEHGFVFGDTGLWETTDGGEHWSRAFVPAGSILSLAIVRQQVLAINALCTPDSGCTYGTLIRRPLSGGSWTGVAKATVTHLIDPDDMIATQAGVAAVLDGRDVLVTRDGGFTFTLNPVPCTSESSAPSVAVTSATGLAILCTGGGYTGHTVKQVYVSDDDGARWAVAGAPSPVGDGGTIAATTTGDVAIATASAASWLFHSGNGGVTWRIVNEQYDGGAGWADLGFTTATDGVVVHGPANGDGNSTGRPGQLFLTSDGGTTWQQASF